MSFIFVLHQSVSWCVCVCMYIRLWKLQVKFIDLFKYTSIKRSSKIYKTFNVKTVESSRNNWFWINIVFLFYIMYICMHVLQRIRCFHLKISLTRSVLSRLSLSLSRRPGGDTTWQGHEKINKPGNGAS